ncbi:hypothetical protein JT358_05795 [Micrococcales bacterium 31B]|nr:hypothetical protein [Micrococcales bacterium 31B]
MTIAADPGGFAAEWAHHGVQFASSNITLERAHQRAVAELGTSIAHLDDGPPVLLEGGAYQGCWLESTGAISAEVLSRFLPDTARATFEIFARHQRSDGLLPYKVTRDGPAFTQIQFVTPQARSVWSHLGINGPDPALARTMTDAFGAYDEWLTKYRTSRGTECIEAFCTYDTGHDLSPRFWHVPDTPHENDPTQVSPDSPLLPFLAPDLTAAVACQRRYLALLLAMRETPTAPDYLSAAASWLDRAKAAELALFEHCFDPVDHFFYDKDRTGRHVRVQSDVLLRVLACEVGDDRFFDVALERYLLNSRKFYAKYPFTSLALDDPRFDPATAYNSWGGTTNMLSLLRAPHAFEAHMRNVELTWVMQPSLHALARSERFAQNVSAWNGESGYTEGYSPAVLCLLDFVERLCGIQPRPDGTLWFTGLTPSEVTHRQAENSTEYARKVDGHEFVLLNDANRCRVYRDGHELASAPRGTRLVTDRKGALLEVQGMRATEVVGELTYAGQSWPLLIGPNEVLTCASWHDEGGAGPARSLKRVRPPSLVTPTS